MNAISSSIPTRSGAGETRDKHDHDMEAVEVIHTRVDVVSTSDSEERLVPPRILTERTASMNSMTSSASSPTATLGAKKRSWWERVVSFRSKRKREEEDELTIDQDLYMRTILESYSSSLSSNRFSSVNYREHRTSSTASNGNGNGNGVRSISSRRAFTDENGGVYVAQPETPNADDVAVTSAKDVTFEDRDIGDDGGRRLVGDEHDALGEDEEEKRRRRIQRRETQEAVRAKLLQRTQHRSRTKRKFLIFALCIGVTLTGFIVGAMLIANTGLGVRKEAITSGRWGRPNGTTNGNSTRGPSTRGTVSPSTTAPTSVATPTPTRTYSTPNGDANVGDEESPVSTNDSGSSSSSQPDDDGSGSSYPPVRVNGTLPPLTGRSALDLLTPKPTATSAAPAAREKDGWFKGDGPFSVYQYTHCLLMSLSLWMSLVVIGMHMTFRSFRTYSMPLVVELSFVQTGYWITSLLRVMLSTPDMSERLSIAFCLAECFFNFGQISFTCAIAFNMYRSVVSYADVLVDTQSSSRRYRSYTVNVMLLSLLASITLALVGYRGHDTLNFENFDVCLYPTCRLILYVYYPLLAFGFNFVFYMRFKRTIGGAYPMSATGRMNMVARSYLVLFIACWGSLITMTALKTDSDPIVPGGVMLVLQCIFDVLGVGTALITLTNYYRCRRAFDFGFSLKAIDPHSIEFQEPLQILGEGTFAIVLRAKWHERLQENSAAETVDVAVKTFKHTQFETLEEMKEEAYLASKLVHPCVMMTYGCYTIGNNLYIVSEYLGGGTLQDVIDTAARLEYERVLQYAHMIAMGMRFLHGLPVPIIHRDLKPLNCIFDSAKEMLKIADFGESRLFRKEGVVKQRPNFFPSFDLTLQMTTNIGSACWAAPEVLKDEAKSEYSLKVDVYSFGIICWQLYTCKVPYTDIPGSVLAVAEAVMGGRRPDIPPDCPTLFSKIMRRCWHEDPVRRPNFEDIVQLLELELEDVQNPPPPNADGTPTLLKTRSSRKIQLVTPRGK